MSSLATRLLVVVSVGCFAGCATFQPVAGDIVRDPSTGGCRDTVTGRFATCPSDGPSAEAVLAGIGIAAGLALIAGVTYALTRPRSPPAPQPHPNEATSAADEARNEAATGAPSSVLVDPHRCIDSAGTTRMIAGAETCASRGLAEPTTAEPIAATPQRGPAATHRILRCYDSAGAVRPVWQADSCAAVGLREELR